MEFKIILKKLKNQLTPREEEEFREWYKESPDHRAYYFKTRENFQKEIEFDTEAAWEKMNKKGKQVPLRLPVSVFAIAAILAIVFGSVFFFHFLKKPYASEEIVSEGTQGKTDAIVLTLEDGSQIELAANDSIRPASHVEQQGSSLVYSSSTAPENLKNTLAIPRGRMFQLVLSDGTRVWLNSESKLRYPIKFSENEPREVELVYGEAFFEVSPSRNNTNQFLLKTNNQRIEVIGTDFNVKSYLDDLTVETVLAGGKVLLRDMNSGRTSPLAPGFKSIFDQSKGWEISSVDVAMEISWKTGTYTFYEKNLEDIMKVISRWYDVEVIFENEAARTQSFNGVFRKSQEIDNILSLFNTAGGIRCDFNENRILIK